MTGVKPLGKGLLAVPKIMNAEIPPEPQFKPQFASRGKEVYKIITDCWIVDPNKRPSADDLVTRLGQVCYGECSRVEGAITSMLYSTFGFISCNGRSVVFHTDSVYAGTPGVGDLVCVAPYDGLPNPRAHPVLRIEPAAEDSSTT